MGVLWAPWRRKYVTAGARPPGCVLCRALEQADRPESLVVHVGPRDFVVMNLYPYNAGHVMIAPHRHVATLNDATPEELSEMMALSRRLEQAFREAYQPDGINLGMNLGQAAGAGVADHIHLHVVPRWIADTNFMGVVGRTRVIPEDPQEAAARLRPYFAR
ncbi:MAG: HIT family hydrolase [Acidobacteria bacterium]|nr:MAG: HIT family hydrolase [Acidobacteriota bacterium]PYQ23515.1 MAG: HIT family hydrolase [Acidobacteriota bacterium]